MYCSGCGAEIKTDARFCTKCGTAVALSADTTDGTDSPAADIAAELVRPARRRWRAVALGIVLIAVLGGGGFFGWRTITQLKLGDTRAVTPPELGDTRAVTPPELSDTRAVTPPKLGDTRAVTPPKLGDTRINPVDQAEMVWVPGGTFTMGSLDGVGDDNEHPAHQVTLSGYWIYKYEVTVAQYRAFCAATGRTLPHWSGDYSWAGKSGWDDPALQQHPIVNVYWDDAEAYAEWAGVSLPTEAQWEYAARGLEGRNYPWGGIATPSDPENGWDEAKCANRSNSYHQGISTWPVGSFPAGVSWCGAHDLAGNVWEWCADWYGSYSATPATNPTGPATGRYRVLRGGSWGYGVEYNCRSAVRYDFILYPGFYWVINGFRCASSSPEP